MIKVTNEASRESAGSVADLSDYRNLINGKFLGS